jgi:hypothetical protein
MTTGFMALSQAIYGHTALQTLAIRAVPPIHIIVENGNVMLEGVVARKMQKNIANIQANGVSGVFSVTNNWKAEADRLSREGRWLGDRLAAGVLLPRTPEHLLRTTRFWGGFQCDQLLFSS